MAEKSIQQETRENLDGDFSNLANVIAMLNWHLTAGVRRETLPDGREGWFIGLADGSQALSILHIADEFAERVMAKLNGEASS